MSKNFGGEWPTAPLFLPAAPRRVQRWSVKPSPAKPVSDNARRGGFGLALPSDAPAAGLNWRPFCECRSKDYRKVFWEER